MITGPYDLTDYSNLRDPRELMAEYDAARGPVNPIPADEANFVRTMDKEFENDRIPF